MARKNVDDMTPAEAEALIRSLTEAEMRRMLLYVAGRAPETFDYALTKVKPS